ncbi:MAG: hypothetical protein RQ756_00065 [Flavobacteriaceae bacterium]|nr:hypothetical protein [Flavobacteriaceae bacterium]
MKKNTKIFIALSIITLLLIAAPFAYVTFKTVLAFGDIKEFYSNTKPKVLEAKSIFLFKDNELPNEITFEEEIPYILNYWATWCKPCIKKMNSLNEADLNKNEYYISIEDSLTIDAFLDKTSINIPVYRMKKEQIPYSPKEITVFPSSVKIYNDSVYKVL